MTRILSSLCLTAVALAPATAQDGRPVAFVNARVLTMAGQPIESGTVLVRDGVIADIGADVDIPAGTRVIDASGQTLMPGLVSAWSRAGLTRPRSAQGPSMRFRGRGFRVSSGSSSSSSSASNKASTKVAHGLYARQDIFSDLLEVGVTTIGIVPTGSGFPGQGAVLNPSGRTGPDLVVDDEAFVVVGMNRNASAKKVLKETFEKAAKVVEERKKPKEPEKKEEPKKDDGKKPEGEKPDGEKKPEGEKPAEKKPEEKAPPEQDPKKPAAKASSRPKKKDPNLEIVADLIEGKRRGFLTVSSAADMVHYRSAVGDDLSFPTTVVAASPSPTSGHLDIVLDHLKALKGPVLMPPSLTTVPPTQALKNIAADLHGAKIEVGFILPDSQSAMRSIFFNLMELVRHGLPADAALEGVTAVPAKALGVDSLVGTLEKGKKANLLVFDGDPLDPTTTMTGVWLEGREIRPENN